MATARVAESPSPDLVSSFHRESPTSPLAIFQRAHSRYSRSPSDPMFTLAGRVSPFHPIRPNSFVPSPDLEGMGTGTFFQVKIEVNPAISVSGDSQKAVAQFKNARVAKSSDFTLIADSYEEQSAAVWTVARFPQLLKSELSGKVLSEAINTACKKLDKEINQKGQVVLMGVLSTKDAHYVMNHSQGMTFLVRQNGDLICLTDYVAPGSERFPIPAAEEVDAGEIIHVSELALRAHPRVKINGTDWHSARGLGYPDGIGTDPIITYISRFKGSAMATFVKGEHLLMITRDCAQNVQRSEIKAAWNKLRESGANCKIMAGKLATWFEARASSEDANIAVVVQELQ